MNQSTKGTASMTAIRLNSAICTSQITSHAHAATNLHQQDSGWCSLKEVCRLLNLPMTPTNSALQFQRRKLKAGQWAFSAGDQFDAVYIVYSGFLKTLLEDEAGNEQILGFPMKGDLLGVDGLHADSYASRAVALTDCELVVIPVRELNHLSHDEAAFENWLYRAVSRELVREHAVISLLGTLGAEARVARFLVSLSGRFAAMGYSATEFNLRMTRQEIGSYLGLTLETVSRSLSSLDEAGLIDVKQRAVRLNDMDGLRTLQRVEINNKPGRGKSHQIPATSRQTTAAREHSIWSGLAAA
jgi:CRP/FNR family transcriptional regulator, anaerobic regulatory protein